jgi:hypothetical protein
MDILPINQQSERNRTVQKLHLRDVMEFIIDSKEDVQKQLITLLAYELKITPISKAKDILGRSYNGVKQFGNVVKLGDKLFAILKQL